MSIDLRPLDVPDGVFEHEGEAVEFIRFWVAGGVDHVILNVGVFAASDEARYWGMICADIAKHAVRGMQQDDPSRGSADQMMAQLQKGFADRIESLRADLTGQLKVKKQ
jgi:hypothetical protein